jgi:hypothetical protein
MKYRSQGGSDELENLVGLCPYHHHRVIHTGYLRITVKDGVVTWWLGGRPFTAGVGDPEARPPPPR